MSKDNANINDQLGKNPDVFPLLNANYTEGILLEEGPTIISGSTLGSAWIVGSTTNGIVGDNTDTQSGNQQVVGGADRVETVKQVVNKGDIFQERILFDTFENQTLTQISVDYSANVMFFPSIGLDYVSKAIAKRASSEPDITQVLFRTYSTTYPAVRILISTDGSTWQLCNRNVKTILNNPGKSLYYWLTSTIGSGVVIRRVIIQYW